MYSALPDVRDKTVLCIGCGTGEECGYISKLGGSVKGIDTSSRSIDIARHKYSDPSFTVMDMNKMTFKDDTFDIVYSSLTLHYSEHLDKTLGQIFRVLRPGGTLLFSVLHPIKWSAEIRRDMDDERKKTFLLGYDSFATPSNIYGDYLSIRPIVQKPEGYPKIKYWNRPISDYLHTIRDAGFTLIDFIEPLPIEELKFIDIDYWNTQSKIPQFMVFVLQK
jgi:SAM-dependent methyltransferase